MDEKNRPGETVVDPRFRRPAVLRALLASLAPQEREAEGARPCARPGPREESGDDGKAEGSVVGGRKAVLS